MTLPNTSFQRRAASSEVIVKKVRWIFAVGVVALAFSWTIPPDRSSVAYHLKQLDSLRSGPFLKPGTYGEWFRWETVQWLSRGGPTYDEWCDALEHEQQALIALGYYERRWVWVPTKWNHLRHPALMKTAVGRTRYTIHGDPGRPAEVRITARPADIDEYAQVLRTLN